MSKLFGKAKKKETPKDSVMQLKETLTMLEKRESYLQKKIDTEIGIAKQNAQRNKKAAIMALKRKKTYEQQMEKIGGARMTIESQVMAIEGAGVSLETMNAMKAGASAMKQIHKGMTIDKVDDTMDDIRDQMDLAEEINSAISQPTGFGMDFDDDELAAELDELEGLELEDELSLDAMPSAGTRSPAVDALPSTPASAPEADADEAAELEALQAAWA